MRLSIMNMMDEMAYVPTSDFELLVCENEENFIFTPLNMVKLREFRDYLKKRLDTLKNKAASKREELIGLWKYLEVPEDSCKMFLDKYSGYRARDLHAVSSSLIFLRGACKNHSNLFRSAFSTSKKCEF